MPGRSVPDVRMYAPMSMEPKRISPNGAKVALSARLSFQLSKA